MSQTVLIAGASGLVGTAAAKEFLDDGWEVIAVSRRDPELLAGRDYEHLPIDLRDPAACEAAVADLGRATHVVYTAVFEKPGLIAGWAEADHIDTNDQMLRNLVEPLAEVADLRHVTVLQGTKAYGIHLHEMRIPGRERHPRDDHENFYWRQEDYIKGKSAEQGFDWTIFRPQLIVGPNHGVVMNLPPIIGVYAAIRRAEGLPFSFPGGPNWVWEAVDAGIVGRAIRWAADSPDAAGEHFNLTNGEVFAWRDMWPAMAQTLGVETGPDESLSLAEYLPARSDLWDQIVTEHDLAPNSMDDLLGESHHYADFCFAYGFEGTPPPAFVSTVKIKQAGFTETMDTEACFCHWLQDLIDRRILPPAS